MIDSHELQQAGMESSPGQNSLYRFRNGSYVLYVTLAPSCTLLDESDYGFPPAIRNLLPRVIDTSYNHAFIDCSGTVALSTRQFKSVTSVWHHNSVDITTLPVVRKIKVNCFKVTYNGMWAIAKFARFDWEIRFIEAESVIYRTLKEQNVGPEFLGHLHEKGRVVGMLLEYIDGRRPRKDDYGTCANALCRLHGLVLIHGDLNLDNLIVTGEGVAKLVDFENCRLGTEEEREEEMKLLVKDFEEDSRRGTPYPNNDVYKEGEYPIGI